MSREKNLKKLRKSLHETQDILNDLITETSSELEKKWDDTRTDAGKRLKVASKRFEKNYEQARSQLNHTLKDTSKEAEKRYAETKKDAVKTYDKTRHEVKDNYKDLRGEALKRYEMLKKNASARTEDLRHRTADLLQGLALGVVSARNKLEPGKRLAVRDEKEKHHLGKFGYFKRFIAIALIIVSKKDKLLSLGQQLYYKMQDGSLTAEAREQFDTMRRLIRAYANGQYREFPYMSVVKIVAAIVYFVSVVDLIPDFIPVLGLTDDLAILAWVYASVKDDMQKFVDWEAANEYRREKMDNQKSGSKTAGATASDREATPSSPSVRAGAGNMANATASAGTTTGMTNTGGGTTSSGVGSTGGSGSTSSSTNKSGGSSNSGGSTGSASASTGSSSDKNKNTGGGSSSQKSSGNSGGGSNK